MVLMKAFVVSGLLRYFLYLIGKIFEDTQVDQQVAKKCLSLKVTNYTLRCNSDTSLRKPERSQRRLPGDVFSTSRRRRLRDLQIRPF